MVPSLLFKMSFRISTHPHPADPGLGAAGRVYPLLCRPPGSRTGPKLSAADPPPPAAKGTPAPESNPGYFFESLTPNNTMPPTSPRIIRTMNALPRMLVSACTSTVAVLSSAFTGSLSERALVWRRIS